MSSLSRSKTAPQPSLSSLGSSPQLPRSVSHQTIQPKAKSYSTGSLKPIHRTLTTPKLQREDPFNLSGFFPTHSTSETQVEGASWWLPEENEEHEEEEEEIEIEESLGEYSKTRTNAAGGNGQMSDEMTRETIKSEDKLGILSFGNFFARKDDERHEQLLSPYSDDEPVDHESLYLSLCARRRAQGIETPGQTRPGRFGELFL